MNAQLDALQTLLDNTSDQMALLDRDYRYLAFNSSHARAMQARYGAANQIGASFLEAIRDPASREQARRGLERALGGQPAVEVFPSSDGSRPQPAFEAHFIPHHGPDGEVAAICLTVDGFSAARPQAADDLERFFSLVPEMVCIVSTSGDFLLLNGAWEKTLGYSCAELLGKPFAEFIHPEDLQPTLAAMQAALQGEVPATFVNRYRARDGAYHWLEWQGMPAPDGSVVYAAARDITERQRAEQRLVESERLYAAIVNSAHEFIASVRLSDMVCLDANPAFCRLVELPRQQIVGRNVREALLRAPAQLRDQLRRQVAAGEEITNTQAELQDSTGQRITVLVSCHFFDLAGERCALISGLDISERQRAEQRLAEELAFNQAIIDNSPVGIMIFRASGELLSANLAAGKISGAPEGKLIDLNFHKLEAWKANGLYALASQALKRKKPVSGLAHGLTTYAREVWLNAAFAPFRAGGEALLLFMFADETERQQAQAALHASEELFNRALRASQVGILVFHLEDGRAVDANPAFLELLGYSRQQVLGHTAQELNLFPDPQAYAGWIETLRREGVIEAIETPLIDSIGQVRHILFSAVAFEAQGNPRVMVQTVDITERKLAEQLLFNANAILQRRVAARTAELEQAQQRLGLALQAGKIGLWEWDLRSGRITYSPEYRQMLGYTEAGFANTYADWAEYVHPDDRAMISGRMEAFIAQPSENHSTEFRIRRKDGSYCWVMNRPRVVQDEQGRTLRAFGAIVDITDLKQAAAAREELTERLQAANTALERALRARDEFLATMSHELRTPLTGILGMTEALGANIYGSLNPRQQRPLETIEKSGQQLLNLINDVLSYTQIQSGRLELRNGSSSLAVICQASLRAVKAQADAKRQQLDYRIYPPSILLEADALYLQKALINLLENAIKFSPENGRISLNVKGLSSEKLVQISVADTGIGIEAEDLPKLFKPFTQLDARLARQYAGTGLGLALVKAIAELHGGQVEVQSVFGQGSTFSLLLPWNDGQPGGAAPD